MKKFQDSSDFKEAMNVSIKRVGKTLFMPVSAVIRSVRIMVQPASVARKASKDVMDQVKN